MTVSFKDLLEFADDYEGILLAYSLHGLTVGFNPDLEGGINGTGH